MKSPILRAWPRAQQPIWTGTVGVYGIQCGDYIKIGVTKDARTRLRSLELTCPYPMRLVAWRIYPDNGTALAMEAALHRELSAQAHHGEWFRLGPVDPAGALLSQYERERERLGLSEVVGPVDRSDEPPATSYPFELPPDGAVFYTGD